MQKVERAWLDAYEKHDAEAMDRFVADDFLITFANGSAQTKPELIAAIRRPRKEGELAPRFSTEDVKPRTYGDTVTLTGTTVTELTRCGKTPRNPARYTDTYVRTAGRWQAVASHLSRAPAEKKAPAGEGK